MNTSLQNNSLAPKARMPLKEAITAGMVWGLGAAVIGGNINPTLGFVAGFAGILVGTISNRCAPVR